MRANGNSTHEILGKIVTAIASIAMTAAFAVPAMAASDSGTAASTGHKQYRMDAFTDRAAERIHSGQCNAG